MDILSTPLVLVQGQKLESLAWLWWVHLALAANQSTMFCLWSLWINRCSVLKGNASICLTHTHTHASFWWAQTRTAKHDLRIEKQLCFDTHLADKKELARIDLDQHGLQCPKYCCIKRYKMRFQGVMLIARPTNSHTYILAYNNTQRPSSCLELYSTLWYASTWKGKIFAHFVSMIKRAHTIPNSMSYLIECQIQSCPRPSSCTIDDCIYINCFKVFTLNC